jgi:hypothetical protein
MVRRQHLDEIAPDEPPKWGNSVYSIEFEGHTPRPAFGHRYRFFLRDAVDDVPEYVVRWDTFVALAAEVGLHPVYEAGFHQVYTEHCEHREYGPLLARMKVRNEQGESQMDEDQWEAASECVGGAAVCGADAYGQMYTSRLRSKSGRRVRACAALLGLDLYRYYCTVCVLKLSVVHIESPHVVITLMI